LIVVLLVTVIDFVFPHGFYRLVFRRFVLANREMTVTLDDDRIQMEQRRLRRRVRVVKFEIDG
jgi:hypothetical protein